MYLRYLKENDCNDENRLILVIRINMTNNNTSSNDSNTTRVICLCLLESLPGVRRVFLMFFRVKGLG